jgi:hypothetical protein
LVDGGATRMKQTFFARRTGELWQINLDEYLKERNKNIT